MSKDRITRFLPLLLALFVPLSLTACGDDDGFSGQLFVASEGTTIRLFGMNAAGDVKELDSAEIPPAGLLSVHAIFGITKHPTEPWLYVTSLNECSADEIGCWGNARIDKFGYSSSGIHYDGIVFSYDPGSGPVCADEDWDFVGFRRSNRNLRPDHDSFFT